MDSAIKGAYDEGNSAIKDWYDQFVEDLQKSEPIPIIVLILLIIVGIAILLSISCCIVKWAKYCCCCSVCCDTVIAT